MADLETVYYEDYSAGLNDTANPREIDRNEASVLRNWDITFKGQLRRRDGLTVVGNQIGSNPPAGLRSFLQSNGAKDLVCMEGPNMRYLNSSTWDILDNSFVQGTNFWFENVMIKNQLYVANEDNNLKYWDRSSTVLNNCLVDLGPAVPHGNVLRWHKNHMFTLNNVNVSGVKYAHEIYWSNLGDPTTWDTVNNHFTVPGNGRCITMIDQGNSLVIFKERSIQYLTGWGSNSWQVTESSSNVANLDEQIGIAGPLALTRVGNEVWFMDDKGQIRRIYQTDFDAFRRDLVCKKIQGTLATINKTVLNKVIMWSYLNRVYCAIPTGTSSVNNLVLVFDIIASDRGTPNSYSYISESWTTYTGWTPGLFTSFPTNTTPDLYIADATTGLIYIHSGASDNGVAIDARWEGKDDDQDKPERYKRYKFGYIEGQTFGSTKVNLLSSVDSSPFATLRPLDLTGGGSRLGPTGQFLLGPTGNNRLGGSSRSQTKFYYADGGGIVRGKRLKMGIAHNALNEQPIVDTFSQHFKFRELR